MFVYTKTWPRTELKWKKHLGRRIVVIMLILNDVYSNYALLIFYSPRLFRNACHHCPRLFRNLGLRCPRLFRNAFLHCPRLFRTAHILLSFFLNLLCFYFILTILALICFPSFAITTTILGYIVIWLNEWKSIHFQVVDFWRSSSVINLT